MAAARRGLIARAGASMAGHASTRWVGSRAPRLTIHLPSPHHGSQRQPGDLRDCRASRMPGCTRRQRASIPRHPSCSAPRPCRGRSRDGRGEHVGDRFRKAEVVRRADRRRLVRRRARQQDLSAQVLHPRDRKPSARRSRLLEREGRDRTCARLREAGQAGSGRRGSDPGSDGNRPDRHGLDEHGHRPIRRRRARHRPIRRRPAQTRPTASGRTPRGPRRSRFRCSCSAGSPFSSSRPGLPAISAAG